MSRTRSPRAVAVVAVALIVGAAPVVTASPQPESLGRAAPAAVHRLQPDGARATGFVSRGRPSPATTQPAGPPPPVNVTTPPLALGRTVRPSAPLPAVTTARRASPPAMSPTSAPHLAAAASAEAPAPTRAPTAPYAIALFNADGSPVRWNPCATIHYVTNLTWAPAGALADVQSAFQRLEFATNIAFQWDGSTAELPHMDRPGTIAPDASRGNPILIAWASPGQADIYSAQDPQALGVGMASWAYTSSRTAIYVSGQIAINPTTTARFARGFGAGRTIGLLLLHELGHVMGLAHVRAPDEVMNPDFLPLPSANYARGDQAGLTRLGAAAGCIPTG